MSFFFCPYKSISDSEVDDTAMLFERDCCIAHSTAFSFHRPTLSSSVGFSLVEGLAFSAVSAFQVDKFFLNDRNNERKREREKTRNRFSKWKKKKCNSELSFPPSLFFLLFVELII